MFSRSEKRSDRRENEYIISRRVRQGRGTITPILNGYAGLNILDELGNGTTLVKMSATTSRRIARDHPELIIEPNVIYSAEEIEPEFLIA